VVKKQVNRQKNIRDFRTSFKITRDEQTPEERIVEGYFALYESETELWEGSYEIISKGAFDSTLNKDVRALWNHNTQYVLGRSKNGSLQLRADDKGLFGTIKLPNTQYANDLYELVSRGDIDQASFGFNIIDEELEELASGGYRWRIKDIDLHEISVVTFPAYENTTVQAREKQVEQLQQRKLQEKKDALSKRLKGLNK
jgi:HK97 family phage prohead protease